MSGPKVVKVITKKEIMTACRSRIAIVKDMIEQWRKYASQHDALTIEEEKDVDQRFLSIVTMFEREQFTDVQKQCTAEINALQSDMNRIREEAIAKAEKERSLRRRVHYSAETLIRTFETTGHPIPEELPNIASSALTVNENDLAAMGSTLNRLLTAYTLSLGGKESVTSLQVELSQKLSEGEKIQTLVDWKFAQETDQTTNSDRRMDRLLAEIEALENKTAAQPFLERASLISKEASSSRRSLLTNSLILDLVAHSNARKEKERTLASMQEIRSELRGLTSKSANNLEALLTQAIASEDMSSSKSLLDKGTALLKEETKAIAGSARREAILKGLTELGYEVRENMATAWAENGRIVVRKPNERDYGVELGGVEDAQTIQVQLVSFGQSSVASKASQDSDRETIWCSEFSRLQTLLGKSGTVLHIEKALPVGAKPLKQVQESSTHLDCERRSKESVFKTKRHD